MLKTTYSVEALLTSDKGNLAIRGPSLALTVALAPFFQGLPGEISGITDAILDTAVEELRYDYDNLVFTTLNI